MKINLKKSQKNANPAVQTGDMGRRKLSLKGVPKKKLLIYSGLVLLVVASVAWLLLVNNNSKDESGKKLSTKEQLIKDPDNLDKQEIDNFVKDNTDQSSDNYDDNYAVAIAYVASGEVNSALKSFEIAATKLDTNNKQAAYEFYDKYARSASSANQRDLAIANYKKAKEFYLATDVAKKDSFGTNQITSQIDAAIKDLQNGVN